MNLANSLNPKLNAIVRRCDDHALAHCLKLKPGPLSGVPFLVKDLLQDVAGIPTTNGSRCLENFVAENNSQAVQKWVDAGLVIFGKTNSCEFGLKTITDSRLFGPARNPWDLTRTPGGSSGGAAGAVAAGIVPMAGGNDGGGSLRIPAAACGLFSLVPGHELNDDTTQLVRPIASLVEHGVITRSVRDAAAALSITHGQVFSSVLDLSLNPIQEGNRKLKIGFSSASPVGTPVDAEAVRAVEDAAALLESLGHVVEPCQPSFDGRGLALDFSLAWLSSIHAYVMQLRGITCNKRLDIEFDTRLVAELGAEISSVELLDSITRKSQYEAAFQKFFSAFDLWLTPTISAPAPKIGGQHTPFRARIVGELFMKLGMATYLRKSDQFQNTVIQNLAWTPYTQITNYLGLPAMSVPLYWTPSNLPLGVQFVAPRASEIQMLTLAAQLEKARPWFNRRPRLSD